MYYFLNEDKTYNPCDLMTWANQFEFMDRHVGDDCINDKRVSTIWLGLDHDLYGGKPLLFETMVFKNLEKGLPSEIYCIRYSTWDEAVEGHKKAIEWVLNGCEI